MKKYILICPNCGGITVTPNPDAMVWESCSSCYRYTWDEFDANMAEPIKNHTSASCGNQARMGEAATN